MRPITSSEPDRTPGNRAAWRGRAPLAVLVAGCVSVVTVAVTGAGSGTPGLDFLQSGHWVYNSLTKTAYHVDGGTKKVDGEVAIEAEPGSQVVQSETGGYVLGQSTMQEFGKSDLVVQPPVNTENEPPIGLEVAGVAYSIKPRIGLVHRLSANSVLVKLGGPLSRPAYTSDGTLWLHRQDTGELCQLPTYADKVSCPAKTTPGKRTALTIVDDRPVVVDLADLTMRSVRDSGLGDPAPITGADFSPDAVVAPHDVGGRIAVLEPSKGQIQLVDTAELTSERPATRPVTVKLPKGRYDNVESSGKAAAVVDQDTGTLRTFDGTGKQQDWERLPRGKACTAKVAEGKCPRLFRGEDTRLYVDSAQGDHVLVVDKDGDVAGVDTGGTNQDDELPPPPVQPTAKPTNRPIQRPRPGQVTKTPIRPVSTDRPVDRETDKPPTQERKTTDAARSPDAPRSVRATAGDRAAIIRWEGADGNGAQVEEYIVSWRDGGRTTVDGSARQATVTGLTAGASYTFTVRARNRIGTGPGAASESITINRQDPPGAPSRASATAEDRAATVTWRTAPSNGSPVTRYVITWPGGTRTATRTTRTLRITGLTNGRSYRFTVAAENTHGRGPGRTTAAVTPQPPRPPGPARSPSLRQTANATLTGRWTAPVDNGAKITGYRVRIYRDSGSDERRATLNESARTFTVERVAASEAYNFDVIALSKAGNSPPVRARIPPDTITAIPEVTIRRGAAHNSSTCPAPSCAWISLEAIYVADWDDPIRVELFVNGVQTHEETFQAHEQHVVHTRAFTHATVGSNVHVVVHSVRGHGALESNHLTWTAR